MCGKGSSHNIHNRLRIISISDFVTERTIAGYLGNLAVVPKP